MAYFFAQPYPDIKTKLEHLEQGSLAAQAEVLVLAFNFDHTVMSTTKDTITNSGALNVVRTVIGPISVEILIGVPGLALS